MYFDQNIFSIDTLARWLCYQLWDGKLMSFDSSLYSSNAISHLLNSITLLLIIVKPRCRMSVLCIVLPAALKCLKMSFHNTNSAAPWVASLDTHLSCLMIEPKKAKFFVCILKLKIFKSMILVQCGKQLATVFILRKCCQNIFIFS